MNNQITLKTISVVVFGGLALAMFAFASFANAATYAYVDTTGEVKPVVADTWQQAIATAVGIHINSGVMLLDSPEDFDIVGNEAASY
jgi:hypothetical protein